MAIDLCWDIIARFTSSDLPKEFYDDFTKMAEDEARVTPSNLLTKALLALVRQTEELGIALRSFASSCRTV